MKVQLKDPQDNRTPLPLITVLAQPLMPPKTVFACYNFVLVKSSKEGPLIHEIVSKLDNVLLLFDYIVFTHIFSR